MSRARLATLAVAIITLIAIARIASTWRVFSQTVDEPIHVAAGLEWLDEGEYTLDVEHPPLPRLLFAVDAWVSNAHVERTWGRVARGSELFYRNRAYRRNLAAARAGNLPWFILATVVVFAWARRLSGTAAGLAAIALFGALPPILGHASLTTTDMAAAATVVTALFFFARWLEEPSWLRTIAFGAAVGVGMLAKFSFLLFFPVGALVLAAGGFLTRFRPIGPIGPISPIGPIGPPRNFARLVLQLTAAAVIALFLVIAGYRFESGLLNEARMRTFPGGSPQHTAARYAMTPGYEWVRPDLLDRYHDYANAAAAKGFTGIDFVDWAKVAGFPSPLAGRQGDTMRGKPPLPPLPWTDRLLEPFRASMQWVATHVPIPGMKYILGAQWVKRHSALGHPCYLFGEIGQMGWWYYFPVLIFFKTPIAFLILAVAGIIVLWLQASGVWGVTRNGQDSPEARSLKPENAPQGDSHPPKSPARYEAIGLACAPLLILGAAMTSGINIGVRHVLPVYPMLAIAAGVAVVELWRRGRAAKIAVGVLLGWFFVSSTLAHPDYLAWFNEAAPFPERIAADSNLDWGQDLLRLTRVVHREQLTPLYVSYFGTADWTRHLPHAKPAPRSCVTGWIAVSEQIYIYEKNYNLSWLIKKRPQRRIGKSIRLYFIPECAKTDPHGQH